ncbi:uncharacterized protein I206_102277 [Kwoniella pini CBS 10737]|uniref:Aminoglycoside phosphotransferase domain-containing protein n=1 Tax=Kwoniella pini CBS 10737 TaxID=1296096 RepID=A0AAJ8L1J1_9TREE
MLDTNMNGPVNYHFPISFDDGVKWLLRVRQMSPTPSPRAFPLDILVREVATLRYMNQCAFWVPNAWLEGSIMSASTDSDDDSNTTVRRNYQNDVIGSLTYPDFDLSASPIVGPFVTLNTLHDLEAPYFVGPFRSNQERYTAHVNLALQYIAEGRICTRSPLDAYLWHLQLRELVATCPELAEPIVHGYIKHPDAKGDHILVDEIGKLIAVIDWQWVHVTTKVDAFEASY